MSKGDGRPQGSGLGPSANTASGGGWDCLVLEYIGGGGKQSSAGAELWGTS